MTLPRLRRRWIVLLVVLALTMGWLGLLDASARIVYYRVIDDHTVAVGAETGPSFWARVTTLTETSSSVVVGVSTIRAPVASIGGDPVELTVNLHDPIGDRAVIDASSGLQIPGAAPIGYYRVLDDHTLIVGAVTGPSITARLWALTETSSSVVVGVSSIRAPATSTGDAVVEVMASLGDPIGARTVIDASSGLPVPRR